MPGRRLIILLVVLLISLSVLSATRDISRTRPPGARTTTAPTTTTSSGPEARPTAEREATTTAAKRKPPVRVRLPAAGTSRIALGSHVIITARSSRPEIVAVEPLGVRAPTGPGTEGELDFVASSKGRYPVTLAISGREIGELEVR